MNSKNFIPHNKNFLLKKIKIRNKKIVKNYKLEDVI